MNSVISQKLSMLTTEPGCYIMRDKDGTVIYVGKAKNLKNRVSQYFHKSKKQAKVQSMVEHIADFDYFITLSEQDAFALENNLIKKYQPFYNILLKDSKTFAYIKINTKEDYPRFEVVRKIKNDGSRYFGPYITGISAKDVMGIIAECFMVRPCKEKITKNKKSRGCLYYFMGQCLAPCVYNIDKDEYRKYVNEAIEFLKGNDNLAQEKLQAKMEKYSEQENFEKAIEMRDKIKIIDKLKQKVVANLPKELSLDAISYISDGEVGAVCVLTLRGGKILGAQNYSIVNGELNPSEILSQFITQYYAKINLPQEIIINFEFDASGLQKYLSEQKWAKVEIFMPKIALKKNIITMAEKNAKEHLAKVVRTDKLKFSRTLGALINLKQQLNLPAIPKRMECYDISNISGTNKVASMVVFVSGEPAKKMYRKFKIKTVVGSDDFKSLAETLTRRLDEYKKGEDESFKEKPDLIIIDGGKGQLSSTIKILEESNIDGIRMISLAKQFEEVYIPYISEPLMLKRNSEELKMLQRIRDEAHRFAITFHRSLRDKGELVDPIDNIKGVGKVKRRALYSQFKTLEKIKNASISELELVKGIDKNLAIKINKYLNKGEQNE